MGAPVLVAHDDAGWRGAVAKLLAGKGFEVVESSGGADALAALRGEDFAAILLTVPMPTLAGRALLRELAGWPPQLPVVVAGSAQARAEVLAGLGERIARYLAPPISGTDLSGAVAAVIAEASRAGGRVGDGGRSRRIPVAELVCEVRAGRLELPAIAPIAGDVQRLLGDPECGVDQVLGVVEQDPAITASILRIANSARFQAARQIRDLKTACLRLGNKRVLVLAQEALLRDLFAVGAGPVERLAGALWRHVLVKANAARAIAELAGSRRPDEDQVAAMLADLGELALLRLCADPSRRLRGWDDPRFVAALGDEIAGAHEEVGGLLLEAWSLAPELARLARRHHAPPRARPPEEEQRLRRVVVAAWAGACRTGHGWYPGQERVDLAGPARALGLKAAEVEAVFADAPKWLEGASP